MAQEAIDSRITPFAAESRPLEQCIGQILRQDVYAERDNPPFDRVCMDGVAVDSGALGRGLRRFTIESMQAAGAPAVTLSRAENGRAPDMETFLRLCDWLQVPAAQLIEVEGLQLSGRITPEGE